MLTWKRVELMCMRLGVDSVDSELGGDCGVCEMRLADARSRVRSPSTLTLSLTALFSSVMAHIVCPGCEGSFSSGAWSLHIAQTRNPTCHAIYLEQRAYLPGANPGDKGEISE